LSSFFLVLRPSLLIFEAEYQCLYLVIKREKSNLKYKYHDIIKITLSTWLGAAGDPASSSDDDSNMIISCWCIGIGATYDIYNTDSSSDLEPDEGDAGGGAWVFLKRTSPLSLMPASE
jgi:hypothetical protein